MNCVTRVSTIPTTIPRSIKPRRLSRRCLLDCPFLHDSLFPIHSSHTRHGEFPLGSLTSVRTKRPPSCLSRRADTLDEALDPNPAMRRELIQPAPATTPPHPGTSRPPEPFPGHSRLQEISIILSHDTHLDLIPGNHIRFRHIAVEVVTTESDENRWEICIS